MLNTRRAWANHVNRMSSVVVSGGILFDQKPLCKHSKNPETPHNWMTNSLCEIRPISWWGCIFYMFLCITVWIFQSAKDLWEHQGSVTLLLVCVSVFHSTTPPPLQITHVPPLSLCLSPIKLLGRLSSSPSSCHHFIHSITSFHTVTHRAENKPLTSDHYKSHNMIQVQFSWFDFGCRTCKWDDCRLASSACI